jgi:stage II sporulation protein D
MSLCGRRPSPPRRERFSCLGSAGRETRPAGSSIFALAVLTAGAVVLAFSGCACERPREPWKTEEVPRVRVRIGKDAPAVSVAVSGPWRLAGADGDIADGTRLDWTGVRAAGGGVAVGSIATVSGPVELHPAGESLVTVDVPGRQPRRYRGYLRLEPVRGGVRVVNVISMEAYLAGVVAKEMYRTWHLEALKAQAVAARTYALRRRNRRRRYGFDLYDTPMSQVYGGVEAETPKAWQAVRATRGVVATYEGGGRRVLLPAFYHSTCGGDTVPSGTVFGGRTPAPLRGGTGCTYCRASPRYRWKKEVVLSKAEVTAAVRGSGAGVLPTLGNLVRIEVAERSGRDGRARRLRLVDDAGRRVLVRAADWRIWVGAGKVPSTWFWIEDRGSTIALTNGRGFGHGVGMCQFGAQYLATHGQTGEQILRYYYPGVDLVRAY